MIAYLIAISPYIIFCILIGYIGRDKKFGFWGNLFASLFLTPLIGLVVLLAQDNRTKVVVASPAPTH